MQIMSETPRIGIDPDTEADKLGSYYLARHRHGIPTEPDEDKPERSGAPKKVSRASRRGGRSYPEQSGRDVSRDIANADRRPITPDQRTTNARGVALARNLLEKAKPVEETAQQKAERQAQEAAELRRKAAESWDQLTNGR